MKVLSTEQQTELLKLVQDVKQFGTYPSDLLPALNYWEIELKPKRVRRKTDPHLGCPSYPNCDEAPNGCSVVSGKDVEFYGHRD